MENKDKVEVKEVKENKEAVVKKEIVISEREKELGSHITKVRFLGAQVVPNTFNRYYRVFVIQLTQYRDTHNSGFSMLEHQIPKDAVPDVFIPFGSEVDAVYLNVPEGQKPVFLRFEGLEKFRKLEDK